MKNYLWTCCLVLLTISTFSCAHIEKIGLSKQSSYQIANKAASCAELLSRHEGTTNVNLQEGGVVRKKYGPIIIVGETIPQNMSIVINENNANSIIIGNKFSNYIWNGGAVIRSDANNILIACNEFINIRSNKRGKDLHAIDIPIRGKNVVILNNLCRNVAADCFQAGDRNKLSSKLNEIKNIFFIHNEVEITTGKEGENAVDIKNAHGPIHILRNEVRGYRPCPMNGSRNGCTGSGGSAVIAHYKNEYVETRLNVFQNNTTHIVYQYKSGGPSDLKPTKGIVANNVFINSKATLRTVFIDDNPGPGNSRYKPDVDVFDNQETKIVPVGFCAGRRPSNGSCSNVNLDVTLPKFAL